MSTPRSRLPLLAFPLLASLGAAVAAEDNLNTTIQVGKVNINHTSQCGDENVNSTYQAGKVNINKTRQGCSKDAKARGQGRAMRANRADPPRAEPALAAKGQRRP